MTRYFTPSALASLYLPNENSADVIALLRATAPPLRITSLHLLEMAGRLHGFPRATELWQQDRRTGYFEVNELSLGDLARQAERLISFIPKSIPPVDLLHIAAALEMECAEFVDFSDSRRETARRAGLLVLPESPGAPEWATAAAEPQPLET